MNIFTNLLNLNILLTLLVVALLTMNSFFDIKKYRVRNSV